jgi:hypothetical protein
MELPLPDIEAFSPWTLSIDQMNDLIDSQYSELKSLNLNDHEYKVCLAMALNFAIIKEKMSIWSKSLSKSVNHKKGLKGIT